jgi:thiol-disulfide isomerase/thioredoxin
MLKKIIFKIILCFLISPSFAQKDSLTVYVFLAETCPICQNQTASLRDLYEEFYAKGIRFVGVFPNETITDEKQILAFKKKYKLPFEVIIDKNQTITTSFGATITPEVFVFNNNSQKTLYSGKIDNSYERIGRRRQVVTAFYLKDALSQILNNQIVTNSKTDAVGCFIVKKI